MRQLMALPGVEWVDMDQCQMGQNDGCGNPVKKPTRWLSNSRHILEALKVKCKGWGGWCLQQGEWKHHTPCYGRVAASAAIYPFKLCRAILAGFVKEMKERKRFDQAAGLVMPADGQSAQKLFQTLWARSGRISRARSRA